MILSNVNIGTGPSVGDGDPLRTAFNTINQNFTKIQTNVNSLGTSVNSVAGRTGNVVLTTQDIVGINNYATISYVSSQIANVGGAANVLALESNVAALQADINTLYGNAGVQSSTLATLTANAAAQAGSLTTLTANAASQAGELTTLLSNAAVQAGAIASLLSNAGSQHEAITSLQSNAAVQSGILANITTGTATFGNLIPSANITYSLGNVTHQWKDLWVSNNTIYLNGIPLGVDAGGNLLVNGAPVSAGTSIGITSDTHITITNDDSNADISLLSGDDITLQGKDKTTSDNEGGDIFIYAGNGGDADLDDAGGSGGDIVIEAGNGGAPSVAYNGGLGGTLDLYGGTGGNAEPANNRAARDGGRARLRAGSAGFNGGNVALGAEGGPVEITAGQTTLADTNGGIVTITSGQGGSNALAGYVEINIPSSDLGQGGSWYFNGDGRTLTVPQDGEIWQPNTGNLSVASAGNVFIRSYDGSQHEWQFGHTGELTLPIGGTISESTYFGADSIILKPHGGTLTQYLEIAPTAIDGNHIHLIAGSGTELYLGNDNQYVKLVDGGDIEIRADDLAGNSYSWTFSTDGNITLPGNINHANGVNILSGLGSADFSNVSLIGTPGNLTIQSPAANTTTTVTQEGGFGGGSGGNTITGGVASSPGFALIQPGWTVTGNNLVGTTTVTNVSGPDGYGTYTITTDTTEVDPFWYNDVYTFTSNTPSYSNLVISSGNIISGNSHVNFVANSSGDGNGYSTIELVPDVDRYGTDQYLIVDPTAPGHIHIRAGGAQDNSSADLILGGENSQVKVTAGSNPPVYILSNNNVWTFTTDGVLQTPGGITVQGNIQFPGNTVQTSAWTGSAPEIDITDTNGLTTIYYPTFVENRTTGQIARADVNLTYRTDDNILGVGNIAIGATGNIKFADGTVQTTAYTGSGSYGNTEVATYLPTYTGNITAGNISASGISGKIGYSSGNFVQQTTSNSTQVTSHFTSGNIQLMSINLAAHDVHTVAFACNKLTTNDMLIVKHIAGGLTSVYVDAYVASEGLAVIWMRDITGVGTGAFTPMLKYAIIRAPSS